MSLRIRRSGEVFCAALAEEEDGDMYIDDNLHYYLSVEKEVLRTYPEPEHTEKGGQWFWRHEAPEGMQDNFGTFRGVCFDCGIPYSGAKWVEAVIPDNVWNDIRPKGSAEGCGLLCINCIAGRLSEIGYREVPVWLCGTEPLIAMQGDPASRIDCSKESLETGDK